MDINFDKSVWRHKIEMCPDEFNAFFRCAFRDLEIFKKAVRDARWGNGPLDDRSTDVVLERLKDIEIHGCWDCRNKMGCKYGKAAT